MNDQEIEDAVEEALASVRESEAMSSETPRCASRVFLRSVIEGLQLDLSTLGEPGDDEDEL